MLNKKDWTLKTIFTLLLSLLVSCSSAQDSEPYPLSKLQADADSVNAKAPYMSDEDTLVFRAAAKEGVFEIYSMLVHLDLGEMSKDEIKHTEEFSKEILTYISCTIEGIKNYLEHDTILIWHYYDRNKGHFFTHEVDLNSCEEAIKN